MASTDTATCPIWGTRCTIFPDHRYDGIRVLSNRAGGFFSVTGSALPQLRILNLHSKLLLSSWIYDQNTLGERPEITSRTFANLASESLISIERRADRLLDFLGKNSDWLGASVDFVLGAREDPQFAIATAMATTQTESTEEISYLLKYLVRQNWVELNNSFDHYSATVTVDGHIRLATISSSLVPSDQAFVAMWFSPNSIEAWTNGIEPAILDSGYRALRIDQKETIQKVDDEIIAEIRQSRFVVVDFTSERDRPRGGVYFEAGFAMGLQKPVIWMCREDLVDQLHFDTRQFSHICWTNPEDLRAKLTNCILAVLGRGPL